MQQLKYIWYIALVNLKRFANDRIALFFFLVFPFIFILIFSFMLRDVGTSDTRLKLHLVTREAAGGLSHQIISALETGNPDELPPGAAVIVRDKDYALARQQVTDKKLGGFLAFPEDFTRAVMMGYGTSLEVVVNPTDTTTRAALHALASNIAARVGMDQLIIDTAVSLVMEQAVFSGNTSSLGNDIGSLMGSGAVTIGPALITFQNENVGKIEDFNSANYIIPGYLVMFTFFAAAQTASVIVLERQNKTLERLLATSARRPSILAGFFLGTLVRGLIQIAIFWIVGTLAFKIDMGNSPLAVIILSLLMVLVSTTFSLMLATLVKTEKSAGTLGILIALVLAPLGGCWWPLFITPHWMQFVAKLIPHGWANAGFNDLMVFGGEFTTVVPNMIVLSVFALAFGLVAVARFRTDAV